MLFSSTKKIKGYRFFSVSIIFTDIPVSNSPNCNCTSYLLPIRIKLANSAALNEAWRNKSRRLNLFFYFLKLLLSDTNEIGYLVQVFKPSICLTYQE